MRSSPAIAKTNPPQLPLYSVRAVVEGITSLVQQHFAGEIRLAGSVLRTRARSTGHALELGEATGTGRGAVRIEAWLPARARLVIAERLGIPFDPMSLHGADVILRVRLRYDGQYGLSAEVLDLDPDYVRSLVAAEVERLRAELRASGDYIRQRSLPATSDLCRIAVIGSQGAGYTDVVRALEPLDSAGLLTLHWISATFEGPRAATSLCGALAKVADLASHGGLDLVLLVRGGGASGLMALNDAAVLRAACHLPVRLVTGLGHADDTCLLDEIAYHAAITPTAAAEVVRADLRERAAAAQVCCTALRSAVRHYCDARLRPSVSARREALRHGTAGRLQRSRGLARELRSMLEKAQVRLVSGIEDLGRRRAAHAEALIVSAGRLPEHLREELRRRRTDFALTARRRVAALDDRGLRRIRLQHASAARLARHRHELERARLMLAAAVHRRLAGLRSQLQRARAALYELSPEHVLRHGYALVLTRDRQPLTSSTSIRTAERFDLILADGLVACRTDEVPSQATRH